ncbi:virulence RhuM family protein (plasmid) [Ligilactobacillus salivarius]|uniref:Virulence RhuM family protein n=1 Tax=Ligilactobacillus salivarius TaxID=1624 RepID=A0ABD7YXL3_9LACO|nr:virulence RhuM family protein [Ligilactobacillus salivarius]WHS05035.1 virulence RhuM family protein [Ligilactobacillus salivarius]WHS09122.1 virulence RhuM family protein [Ligilactobacillus salivarius]WHS11145.1 virulence RhuM family protein [Ligilactobacillus salivarius]WHS15239.1 virulence RhuM family protein [Ligilactobacillus salivarius]WHS18663.1 virulence RhuM family protein [Ligilactobacillus salivarius]
MSKFLIYKTETQDVAIDVIVDNDTIWATQKSIAQLFGKSVSTISRHIKDIFDTGELDEKVVVAKNEITTQHGAIQGKTQTQNVNFYNLDMIISVGYRVNSIQATRFRQWATQTLREYMIKGFVLDDERLKQGSNLLDKDYFDELLERVRSIRASERRIWQKITDIFAEISIDYDKNSEVTKGFYANVQNKFHYAITGRTAAEIIYTTADHTKQNMGLTTWKNAPKGRILKSDTKVAKNYLDEKQIKQLERNVSGYFDYIEDLIERRNTFTMEQFAESIDRFLEFREYKILHGYGGISMKQAQDKAGKEYDIFNKNQPINSDFDKSIKKMIDNTK